MVATEMHEPTRTQLRGSSLLLAGRLLSTGMQFVSQVLIVRHLTTTDFGAFAYALTAVSFFEHLSSLGLKSAVSRFAPIYHEQRDFARLAGVIVLVLGVIAAMSAAIIAVLFAFPGLLARLVHGDAQPVALLGILIFLVPLEALDELLLALFASFAKARAIFWRKHVLGPGLKLVVVAMLVGLGADANFLAGGRVLASLAGVLFYAVLFVRLLRRTGLWTAMRTSGVRISLREVFGFTIPLLASDLINTVIISAATFLIGYWRGTVDVALFRVVFPAARLNMLVWSSFSILYTPAAARLFARGDRAGIETLYQRTAVWLAALSFPVLLITGGLARSLTELLYGERYAAAWPILVLLSLGYFANIATGFDALTLRVMGMWRHIVGINLAACLFQLLLLAILIPKMGPLGAAIASCIAAVVHNVLRQVTLRRVGHMRGLQMSVLPFYATLLGAVAGLLAVQEATHASFWMLAPLAIGLSFGVLWLVRSRLGVVEILPEMGRIPFLGRWLTTGAVAPGWKFPRLATVAVAAGWKFVRRAAGAAAAGWTFLRFATGAAAPGWKFPRLATVAVAAGWKFVRRAAGVAAGGWTFLRYATGAAAAGWKFVRRAAGAFLRYATGAAAAEWKFVRFAAGAAAAGWTFVRFAAGAAAAGWKFLRFAAGAAAPGWPQRWVELRFENGAVLFVALVILNAPALVAQRFSNAATVGALVMTLVAVPAFCYALSRRHLVIDWSLVLMLGFLAASLVSTLFARDAAMALDWTLTYTIEGVLVYLLIVNAVREPRVLRRVLVTAVAVAALLSVMSLYQELSRDYNTQFGGLAQRNLERGVGSEMAEGMRSRTKVLLAHRASGPIGDPNRYAQVLLVVAPLAYVLVLLAKNRAALVAAVAALACILGGIATTYSRSTFLVAIGLVIAAASTRFLRSRHLAALLVFAILVPLIAPGYGGRVRSVQAAFDTIRGRKVDTVADGATRGRLTEMLAAWNVFVDHPLVGVGPGHFTPYYSVEFMSDPSIAFRQIDRPRRAHSLYFELAAETGILGLITFAAIVLVLGARLWMLRRRALARLDSENAALATALAFALLAYLGTACFLHLSYQRYFWLFVGIAGATVQVLGERAPVRELHPTWRPSKPELQAEGA